MTRTTIFVGSIAAVYVAIEVLSLCLLLVANQLSPGAFLPTIERDFFSGLDDSDLLSYLNSDYDPILGWTNVPGSAETSKNCLGATWTESYDSDGAREVPLTFAKTLIASYGDSYVKGGDLNNDQTWQFQLSQQIGFGVKNYAVGAYGSYQALLRLKQHLHQGKVFPITILGINEQNVTRVVNLYRPFLYRQARARFSFKPGISCVDGHCNPVGNLLQPSIRTIDEVEHIALEAEKLDYWAQTKPSLRYPWSVNLAKLGRYAFEKLTSDESEPLWFDANAVAAMRFVVSEFREAVRNAGSLPVVLFIQGKPKTDLLPSYRAFKERIRNDYPDIIVLDITESEFDPKKFKLKPSGACHPSEYGHQVIAETVEVGLRDELMKLTDSELQSAASE